MYTLAVGDLHLGNANADVLSFLQLLERVKDYNTVVDTIVLVGDFLDGLDKYSTQSYKQYPQTLEVQKKMLRWLIELLHNEFPLANIVLVLGNHEADFRGVIFDQELLDTTYPFVKIARYYIDRNDMLYIHQLGRGSRFGSQSGWTPSTVSRALAQIAHVEREHYGKLRGLVTAHVHKVLDILTVNGYKLVLLPAFLKTGYETSEDVMYNPAIVLIAAFEGYLEVKMVDKSFNRLEEVIKYNDLLTAMVRNNYSKITTISAALRLQSLI